METHQESVQLPVTDFSHIHWDPKKSQQWLFPQRRSTLTIQKQCSHKLPSLSPTPPVNWPQHAHNFSYPQHPMLPTHYHSLPPQVCYNMTLKSCSPWSSRMLSQFPNPTVSQAMNHFPTCPPIPSTKAEGEGYSRGWDGWMASLTQWTWVWVSSGSWWWMGKPDVLQSMGSQKVGHDWATELN